MSNHYKAFSEAAQYKNVTDPALSRSQTQKCHSRFRIKFPVVLPDIAFDPPVPEIVLSL